MFGGETESFRDSGLAFQSCGDITAMQNALLRRHVSYLAGHSPYYRQSFAAAGVDPSQVQSISDLVRLPLTSKDDLALRPEMFHCVAAEEFADLCLTSGTTGKPVALPQTIQDLERVGFNEEMSFRIAGISRGDRVLVAAAMDRCFMAGLAYFLGLNRVGALAIRGGSSSIHALAELVQDHRPTAIVGVPTLLLRLAESLQNGGSQPAELGVERLICIGEPVRRADLSLSVLGQRLTEIWDAKLFGTYACTEMATAFTDCEAGCGGHVIPELIIVEIIDERGEGLPPGQVGEVVVTPLQVKGMPLLRFRTGDMAALHNEPCGCGRNSWRLGPILGRRAQMLKYRGTTLFPSAIFRVLEEIDWIRGYYLEVFNEFELSDRVRIVVGSIDAHPDAAIVAERIAARIRVKPELSVVSPEDILKKITQPGKRKPVTFFDYRESPHKRNE